MIVLAKRGGLHARRQALAVMRDKGVVHKLFEEAQSRFGGTAGGYTRVLKIGRRRGDAAPISLVEFVSAEEKQKRKKKKPKAPNKKELAAAQKAPQIEEKEIVTGEEREEGPTAEAEKEGLAEPKDDEGMEAASPALQEETQETRQAEPTEVDKEDDTKTALT
jgi:large subunit ribosomal protein L17